MNSPENIDQAVETLQELGLKEYEARCFVGLVQLESGTAKRLDERTDVPRTRVYDAIRVLESKGLVEVHHSSPQQFRAVPLEEALESLRDQYEDRVERLHNNLETIEGELQHEEEEAASSQEVWSMTGSEAIENRTEKLIETASNEVVLVVCDERVVTDDLIDTLNTIGDGIDLLIGATTKALQKQVQDAVPSAVTFTSGLEWLQGMGAQSDETAIGRLLLVDRSALLVSSIKPNSGGEQAIFGEGFTNGLVVISRRLMAQGLLEVEDPRA